MRELSIKFLVIECEYNPRKKLESSLLRSSYPIDPLFAKFGEPPYTEDIKPNIRSWLDDYIAEEEGLMRTISESELKLQERRSVCLSRRTVYTLQDILRKK